MASYLTTRPVGAYTCVRGDDKGKAVLPEFHAKRMLDTFGTIFASQLEMLDKPKIFQALKQLVRHELEDREIKLSTMVLLLAFLEHDALKFESKEFPMPATRTVLNHVLVGGGGPRRSPHAKNSAWVTERKPLETIKQNANADELILVMIGEDGDILLLEGLVTNFFVMLKDGKTLVTAPPSEVLAGSMRQTVINAALVRGFKVVETCPKWSSKEEWACAFITNCTKPCCPIKLLTLNVEGYPADAVELDTSERSLQNLFNQVDILLMAGS